MLNWEQRYKILTNIKGVYKVVKQNEWDYSINIRSIKPDFLVHGDNWDNEPSYLKSNALQALSEYGGKLIEIPYTKGVSSAELVKNIIKLGTTPDHRRNTLRRLLDAKPLSQFLEAHSPISALIAENVSYENIINFRSIGK